ncbi:MAG: winged helix-turn-helix transcriptional regulator [Alphaproteobacteria bacterium]|nr:winged helix-turn-helix transcriptional regulator [Alphaproteobacteria bacterium]
MPEPETRQSDCNCQAIRQAARHVTQLYDQLLAPAGLRATQFGILARLHRSGPMSINRLAAALVMDRTTLGRNILPLERDGLVEIGAGVADRRRREIRLTDAGVQRLEAARQGWAVAQARFEAVFGAERAAALRDLLRAVVGSDFATRAETEFSDRDHRPE